MIAALIVPQAATEETLEEAIRKANARGLVPCRPAKFDPEQPWRVTFLAPECINANWRRMVIAVKSPTEAVLQEHTPCPA